MDQNQDKVYIGDFTLLQRAELIIRLSNNIRPDGPLAVPDEMPRDEVGMIIALRQTQNYYDIDYLDCDIYNQNLPHGAKTAQQIVSEMRQKIEREANSGNGSIRAPQSSITSIDRPPSESVIDGRQTNQTDTHNTNVSFQGLKKEDVIITLYKQTEKGRIDPMEYEDLFKEADKVLKESRTIFGYNVKAFRGIPMGLVFTGNIVDCRKYNTIHKTDGIRYITNLVEEVNSPRRNFSQFILPSGYRAATQNNNRSAIASRPNAPPPSYEDIMNRSAASNNQLAASNNQSTIASRPKTPPPPYEDVMNQLAAINNQLDASNNPSTIAIANPNPQADDFRSILNRDQARLYGSRSPSPSSLGRCNSQVRK